MTTQLIELVLVADNPYQPRITDNPEHIENLARSIAADGLLQAPAARALEDGSYQLAFGHSRRKAIEWLRDNYVAQGLTDRFDGYTVIPLEITPLTDEDMYRQAIAENVQRRDLDPIEQAKAMLVYRDQFGKSSAEIGALFGLNDATVRGVIRLLDLPETVQEKISAGEISQGSARKLLTIARVDAKQIKKAIDSFAAGASAEDVVMQSMRDSDTAFAMWQSWNDGKPRGGEGLWPLDMKPEKFPMAHLPGLRAADVAKALEMEFTADLRSKIEDYIGAVERNPDYASQFSETKSDPNNVMLMERISQLLFPPACAACPFHAAADRVHYCGFKACHQRKRTAWVASEMQKVSKRLSIPIYNPITDGKTFIPLQESTWQDDYKRHAKLVSDQDADLRIAPHKNEYSTHKWTESNFCRVILIGEKAVAKKDKQREVATSQTVSQAEREKQWARERELMDASRKFATDYAIKLFAVAFKDLDHVPAMCALVNAHAPRKDAKKNEVLAALRVKLAECAIDNLNGYSWQLLQTGPIAVAKYLQGVATTWGVKLPEDFADVAKRYMPAVAAETIPQKKTKKKEA